MSDETIEVEMDSSLLIALAQLDASAISTDSSQARHGDIYLSPGVYGKFNDESGQIDLDEMHQWLAKEQAETPQDDEGEEETDDKHDIQGWTYLADYSIHPLSPNHSGPRKYYIHARVRHDNRLEFGVFSSKCKGEFASKFALARLMGTARAQVLHGDLRPALRIAGKAESEAMMMKGGKLILAAQPRLLGVLMLVGMGKLAVTYGETTTYRSITYYGHIWTYWGTMIDNTLYFVGLPLYTGSDRGAFKCSIGGEEQTYRISLPPTIYDVRAGSGNFMAAAKLLWGHRAGAGFERTTPMVEQVLNKYGDRESPAILCRRALAKVTQIEETEEYAVEQIFHGDIGSSLSLYSTYGGAYFKDGSLTVCNGEDVSHSHIGSSGTMYSSGASGFIPTKTRCNLDGWVRYMAQAFYVYQYGPSYQIRILSPFHPYGYIPDVGETGYKLLSWADARITIPKEPDEEEEKEEDDDDGGGGGGGGGGDDDDDPPGGNEPEDLGDCGIWLESSGDASVSASREDKDGKIGYRFKISIGSTISVSDTLHYTVTLRCSVADGGSYSVGEGTSVTMWYYLTGQIATITVCNLTSKSWNGSGWASNSHPSSTTSFEQTGLRSATATGSFPSRELTSHSSVTSCNQSNIVKLVSTGRTKETTASLKYTDAEGRVRHKRVKASFKCYKLVLQKTTIRQILKNTIRRQTASVSCAVKPGSIAGSGGGAAGAPTVTSSGASAKAVKLPIQGETTVKGSYPMTIKGKLGKISVSYSVGSGMTGWYEGTVDNRQSASISGTFKVTAAGKSF